MLGEKKKRIRGASMCFDFPQLALRSTVRLLVGFLELFDGIAKMFGV